MKGKIRKSKEDPTMLIPMSHNKHCYYKYEKIRNPKNNLIKDPWQSDPDSDYIDSN